MNNKGVTLIELLIVIVVLGIVSAFSVVAVSEILDSVRRNSFVQNGVTFMDVSRSAHDIDSPIWDDDKATLGELIESGFIQNIGKDPWGGSYDLDETYVTVEVVSVNTTIYRARVISSKATIGYEEVMEVFTKADVVLLNSADGNIIEKIIEIFNDDINGPYTTDDGDDEINVGDDVKGTAEINTSGGNDILIIGDDVRHTASIDMGEGDDELVVGGSMTNSSTVDTGDGDDTLTISKMIDDSVVDTGEGNDTVGVGSLRDNVIINTGGGNDTVNIFNCAPNFTGSISLGSGNDNLTIIDSSTSVNLAGTTGTFDGGIGDDTLYLPNVPLSEWNSSVSSLFSNFETIVLKDTTINQ